MEDFDLSDYLLPWALRLLKKSPSLPKLLKEENMGDDDVAAWLGLDALTHNTAAQRRVHFNQLCQAHLENPSPPQLPVHYTHNFEAFAKLMEINHAELAIVKFLVFRHVSMNLSDVCRLTKPLSLAHLLSVLSEILEIPAGQLRLALNPGNALVTSGLVSVKRARNGIDLVLTQGQIAEPLLSEDFSPEGIIGKVVPLAPPARLTKTDFLHAQETLDFVRPYLRNALRKRQAGVNLFLYGEPGTGKSELARTLARELKAKLYEVSFEDSDGEALSGQQRIDSLVLAQRFLSKQRAVLVFDEAEDVFGGATLFSQSRASMHKAWMNRMLETNRAPTIWISNSIDDLDPAFVRRFDFVFEIKSPPRTQRLRILKTICGDRISPSLLDKLAEESRITPAIAARAHAVAEQSCTRKPHQRDQAMLHLVRATLSAQGHRTTHLDLEHRDLPEVYDLSLLNADTDLRTVAQALKTSPSCRICLYGPPGTGKTSFGHWLARELETSLHVRKASDILAPYLGLSERNIAGCFREASEDKGILMLDEVDSFLQDRRHATRSWEITLTNELLTQMERFPGIFIASTNLMDGLDQAALRRFDLKIRIDYLHPEQSIALAERWFAQLGLGTLDAASRSHLYHLTNLTPGDFGNVARQHRFRCFPNPAAWTVALTKECELKEGNRAKLGFTVP